MVKLSEPQSPSPEIKAVISTVAGPETRVRYCGAPVVEENRIGASESDGSPTEKPS